MRMALAAAGLIAVILAAGCTTDPSTPTVSDLRILAQHSPIFVTDGDSLTIEANVETDAGNYFVFLFVEGVFEEVCDSTPTCTTTVGPLNATDPKTTVVGRPIEYEAIVLPYNYDRCTVPSCQASDMNVTAITGPAPDYLYGTTAGFPQLTRPVIPILQQQPTFDAIDLVFHQATDYDATSLQADFLGDVEDKVYDVYLERDLIAANFEAFNFYVYTKPGEADGCGVPDPDIASDATFRDVDAVLHALEFRDCAIGSRFSAEGYPTKAFLHESGHAVFGLADEYDGDTNYFEPAVEPNIWADETDCENEQSAQGRSTGACTEFTNRQGGWWRAHAGTTVMLRGFMADPWGFEGEERLEWVFAQQ
jgi:hypothetical protein